MVLWLHAKTNGSINKIINNKINKNKHAEICYPSLSQNFPKNRRGHKRRTETYNKTKKQYTVINNNGIISNTRSRA